METMHPSNNGETPNINELLTMHGDALRSFHGVHPKGEDMAGAQSPQAQPEQAQPEQAQPEQAQAPAEQAQAPAEPVIDMPSGMALFLEFQALTERKAAIKTEDAQVKARLAQLEPVLVDFLTNNGLQNIKAGGRTFSLTRQLFAGRTEGTGLETLCDAMKSAGLGDMVSENINANTLKAWVREQAAELEAGATPDEIRAHLPAGLGSLIKVAETYCIRSRKA